MSKAICICIVNKKEFSRVVTRGKAVLSAHNNPQLNNNVVTNQLPE